MCVVLDLDECETQENECDANAECINTAGSYDCVCKAGYSGNGINCQGKHNICDKVQELESRSLI